MARYADELRRMTRAQGGTPEPPPSADLPDAPRARRWAPFAVLLLVAVLSGVGWLVVREMMAISKLQDCVMSGRKNCAPVEVDSAN
jgi:hypothetical protein